MMDLIVDVVLWMAVIWLIMKVVERYLIAKNTLLEQQIKTLQEQIENSIINVEIEKHNNVFYLFEKETHRFIAQGSNFEEIKKHCQERFKNKSVVASEEQMNQLDLK